MGTPDGRWNHNIHYQRLVLREIPDGARRALDVGCGEGVLARELARRVPDVVGVDRDAAQIELARRAGGGARYVCGDFLTADLGPPYDLVASIAALHHVDAVAGLRRLAPLVAPGGRLVVIGLGRREWLRDLPWDAAGFFVHRFHRWRHGLWLHSAPIADPVVTCRELRRLAAAELPGSRFRRLALFRYLLLWTKPG